MAAMPTVPARCIVVGASSGIGAALVKALAARGERVVALARRMDLLADVAGKSGGGAAGGEVIPVAHDVRDVASIPAAFAAAMERLGGLDRIIYAAGAMPKVAIDEFSVEKDREIVEVNVLGAIAWLDLAARHFQERRAGQIVAISSVAGERGRRPYPAYCASKAALTTFLESLRNRLTRLGVSVVTVKPGFIGTDMLKNAEKVFWVITPEECARRILAGADARRQSFYVPARWGFVAWAIRSIPSFLFRRMNV
jgi:NAD(P)-dependent dehydrogenase (short-subunit alcohol dehydrogenase family)